MKGPVHIFVGGRLLAENLKSIVWGYLLNLKVGSIYQFNFSGFIITKYYMFYDDKINTLAGVSDR